MEFRRYWQVYGGESMAVNCFRAGSEKHGSDTGGPGREREIFVHGGRSLSLEAYLAVPTFVRRGIAIPSLGSGGLS